MLPIDFRQVSRQYALGLATDLNSSSFPSKVPTITAPSENGVLDVGNNKASIGNSGLGYPVPWGIELAFLAGSAADDDAYEAKIIGWVPIGFTDGNANVRLWVPRVLAWLVCTVGTATGVDGTKVPSSYKFIDTITVKTSSTISYQPVYTDVNATPAVQTRGSSVEIFNPADNTIAWTRLNIYGSTLIEFIQDQTTNAPTMNVLYRFL